MLIERPLSGDATLATLINRTCPNHVSMEMYAKLEHHVDSAVAWRQAHLRKSAFVSGVNNYLVPRYWSYDVLLRRTQKSDWQRRSAGHVRSYLQEARRLSIQSAVACLFEGGGVVPHTESYSD